MNMTIISDDWTLLMKDEGNIRIKYYSADFEVVENGEILKSTINDEALSISFP